MNKVSTRTQHIKVNLFFSVSKYLVNIFLQFVLKTFFMFYMGISYLGLDGLFTNIFSFLNLVELGVGSAIVFSMYKPIAENDTKKIIALQNLYRKFYLIIAIVILFLGFLLTPFLNFFVNGESVGDLNLYVLFFMYLFNCVIKYFFEHKKSLLYAHQRSDVLNKIHLICSVLMIVIQIAVIALTKNYYLFYFINIIFTILECIFVLYFSNKIFPELNGKENFIDKETKKQISKNICALSMHKIGSAVVFSTDNILISSFFGLTILGIYSNYWFVISGLASLFTLLYTVFCGSVGDLIARNDIDYVYLRYKKISAFFSFITSFSTVCLFVLFQPFISFWTLSSSGCEELLNFSSVVLLCLSFYLTRNRTCSFIFEDSAGLMWFDRWKPIVEALVNIATSIILAILLGINGIILGTIISTIVAPLWVEPMVIHRHYFKKSLKNYFFQYLIDFLITIFVAAITYLVCMLLPNGGICFLILKFAVCIVLSGGLLFLLFMFNKDFRSFIQVIKKEIFKNNKSKEL